jgi:hypothetical protein
VTTRRRRQVTAAVAVLAVGVQLVAVALPSGVYVQSAGTLTGTKLFDYRKDFSFTSQQVLDSDPAVPFGRDPMRWVPELSPLVVHTKLVASMALERAGGDGLTFAYAPFEGRRVETDLGALADGLDLRLPTFWWTGEDGTPLTGLALAGLLLVSLAGLRRELAGVARPSGPVERGAPARAPEPVAATAP